MALVAPARSLNEHHRRPRPASGRTVETRAARRRLEHQRRSPVATSSVPLIASSRIACPSDRARAAHRSARIVRLPALAMVGILLATWLLASVLTAAHPVVHASLPGARVVAGGERYTARPGDTLWSIASAFEPNADPRPLVDELATQLQGGPLEAGQQLLLP